MLAALARLLLDAVAPTRCAGCDAVSERPICADLRPTMERDAGPAGPPDAPWQRLRRFEFVEPVRAALHRGKYGGDRRGPARAGRA